MQAETSNFLPAKAVLRRPYDEVTRAVDLYADPAPSCPAVRYGAALGSGLLDEFSLEDPPGETDFRFLDGTGPKQAGRLYVYDAAGGRILEHAKRDGRLIDEWSRPQMEDVRGMVVVDGAEGRPPTVAWMTPDGLFERVLSTDPAAVHRTPAPRRHRAGGVWRRRGGRDPETTRAIRSLIRSLEDLRPGWPRRRRCRPEFDRLVSEIGSLAAGHRAAVRGHASRDRCEDRRVADPRFGFEADRLRIKAGGRTFTGTESTVPQLHGRRRSWRVQRGVA